MQYCHEFLAALSRRAGGSYYLFDTERFRSNFLGFRQALRRYVSCAEVAYAFKANYMPAIGEILRDEHGMGEVVSRFEYDVASRYLDPERIIFNGPVKRKEDLRYALTRGSHVNLDAFSEIDQLRELVGEGGAWRVGLRICFPHGEGTSRFGFHCDNGELNQALNALAKLPGVEVNGLHCHFSTRDRRAEDFALRVERLMAVAKRLACRYSIKTINIGGGFFGSLPEALRQGFSVPIPDAQAYAAAIGKAFSTGLTSEELKLIAEPGIALVGDTMSLVAEVIEVRERFGSLHAVIDTSVNAVNPTNSRLKSPCFSITKCRRKKRVSRYRLVGNTCMEHDVIDPDFTGSLASGDFIMFANRGAYSINYTPAFITAPPAIFDLQGNLLKAADNSDSILSTYRTDDSRVVTIQKACP
ncbi:alanine racemase [Halomonas sp. KM-1]|uniref:alanine racemase n=1 Tax=Halomonas sp. KM-1 TaxID=590061 RepID=UPI0002886BEF|nr:alanine racemase [Halomonas sp. KM-1]